MEIRCYCKTFHISYKDRFTNEDVCAKIQLAIGPHEGLLTNVKKTQTAVVWTCLLCIRSGQNHLVRHSERGKKKAVKKRWEQGMDRPGGCQVPEGNGEQKKWRKLVVKSSVVPQQPSRLSD